MKSQLMCSPFVAVLLISNLAAQRNEHAVPDKFNEATVAHLRAEMASGRLTSEELTKYYLTRIIALDQKACCRGPGLSPKTAMRISMTPIRAAAAGANKEHDHDLEHLEKLIRHHPQLPKCPGLWQGQDSLKVPLSRVQPSQVD